MSRISVIIPAYGPCPHLLECLRALRAGSRLPDELIVSHSGPDDPSATIRMLSPEIEVLHSEERLLAGAARNRGAERATGEWLAFVDADVRPAPEWLEALLERATDGSSAEPGRLVVGSVGVAATGGYWGMANWICEFSEQAPWHPARQQVGGASCSMMVAASDFELTGGFAEAFQPGEDTELFAKLRAAGREHWFEPRARVDHFNATGLTSFARHQVRLGHNSALVRRRIDLPGSLAVRFRPLAVLLWLPRWLLGLRRLLGDGFRGLARAFFYAPGMLLGALIWNRGFLGHLFAAPANASPEAILDSRSS